MGGHCGKTEGLKGVVDGQIDINEGWKDISETSSHPSQGQSIASSADSRSHRIGVCVPPPPSLASLLCAVFSGLGSVSPANPPHSSRKLWAALGHDLRGLPGSPPRKHQ